ncbi:uncharacterized protein LOC121863642 [Homarus americanus]|uniref:uncharacterized protein LOC121863642 n=1 Tax=Homarus americanus TaxID=6706 RepID=UPI001C46A692|nr:uncharacterized protein LOC121863642 [Homarus americanus]
MVIEETSLPQGKQRSGIEEQDTHKPQNQEWQAGHPEMSSSPTEYRTIEVNQEGPAREIWVADQDCFKLRVRYAKDIDGTLLESFPRSGNTWVRYLLEGATGIFTSSVYRDGTLTKAGGLPKIRFLGERYSLKSRNTIVTKSHYVKHLRKYPNVPAIIIIRNPARVIVSFWSYLNIKKRTLKHIAVFRPSSFRTNGDYCLLWFMYESVSCGNGGSCVSNIGSTLEVFPNREVYSPAVGIAACHSHCQGNQPEALSFKDE